MTQEEKELLIQRYLDGDLSASEKNKVEVLKEEDKAFAQVFSEYERLVSGMQGLSMDLFKKELDNWEQAYQAKQGNLATQQDRTSFRKYYSLVAVLLLLIITAIFLLLVRHAQAPKPETLYAQYFVPYDDLLIDRSADTLEQLPILYEGIEAYREGNYTDAEQKLLTYLDANPQKQSLYLYLGIACMEQYKLTQAVQYFDSAAQNPNLSQQAQWYTALSFLKGEQFERAKALLTEIANPNLNHYKQDAATQLLESLSSR